MFVQLILLGSGLATYLHQRKKSKLTQQANKIQIGKKTAFAKFNTKKLLKDFKTSVLGDERQQQQLILDADSKKLMEKYKKESDRKLVLSAGATALALLGTIAPVFSILGIGAVLYLGRDIFNLVWQDFKKGHFLSVYLIGLFMMIGMIVTGHLVLAALSGLFGGFMIKIVKKAEDSSERRLINVFTEQPNQVWIEQDGVEIQVNFNTLKKEDIVIVNAGEVIPVDGLIKTGLATIDQHLLTGEAHPVERETGDKVFASTLLLSGRITIILENSGENTVTANISHALNNAQHYKENLIARGQKVADSFIPWEIGIGIFTLVTMGPVATIAVMWSALGTNMALLGSLSVLNYLQILSRQNILVRDGRVFESLRQVDTVVFDKTGTLTLEQPTVGKIHYLLGYDEETVLCYAAAAEYRQTHPVALAILAKAKSLDLALPDMEDAHYELSFGIQVNIENQQVHVGSKRFMQLKNITLPSDIIPLQQQAEKQGYSLIYIAIEQQLAGILEIQPTIRPEAKSIVRYLKQRNLNLYILSGDHEQPTRHMAKQLGIDNYFAETLPENKAELIQQLRDEGKFVCFVGDGINDAIALKSAQVSISLKGASSAAVDTAQIIFMDGNLHRLPTLFKLSEEFEKTMHHNLISSVAPGVINIAGVFFLHTGIAMGIVTYYLGSLLGMGSTLLPLVKYQDKKKD